MEIKITLLRLSLLIFISTALISCGTSKPSNFFLLSDSTHQKAHIVRKAQTSVIGVGPVIFAKYLNQPQIVTRDSLNQIHLDEFNRWAEPLADNFSRVLTQNLNALLPHHQVIVYPSANLESIHYQVSMNITRFDATTEGKVICEANWEIINKLSNKRLLYTSKSYSDFIGNHFSYSQLANSLSRITARIAQDIKRGVAF